MAKIGAKFPCWKGKSDSAGIVLGKLNQANVTINNASADLYGDDSRAEFWSEVTGGQISIETTHLSDTNATKIFGHTASNGLVTCKVGDAVPEGKFAYYRTGVVNNVPYYKFYGYPRVKAVIANDSDQTKGSNMTFSTENVTFEIMGDESTGEYREFQTFDTEAAAISAVQAFCSVTESPGGDVSAG